MSKNKKWMHYSGHKEGYEKMMAGAPDIKDHTFNFSRPGESNDTIDHEAFGKAQANFAARAASGAWMMDTVGKLGRDKKGDPVYRHPHLAEMAKKGYTFNDIQSAGNKLGITSFNSENDAKAISKFLDKREGSYAEGLIAKLKGKKKKGGGSKPSGPVEYSDQMKAAMDATANFESDYSSDAFQPQFGKAADIDPASEDPSQPVRSEKKEEKAQSFLEDYKLDLKTAFNLQPNLKV